MTKFVKLEKYIQEIDELKKLDHKNPKSVVWINKVLRYLKSVGEDYHDQFYSATHGRVTIVTGMTDSQFQQEYLERLEKYRNYLEAILEELEGETESIKGNDKKILEIISTLDTVAGIFLNARATRKKLKEAIKLYDSYQEIAKESFPNREGVDLLKLEQISAARLSISGTEEIPESRKDLATNAGQLKRIFEDELSKKTLPNTDNDLFLIDKICSNFHKVVRQLGDRYNNREPFNVVDEYDVQDLLRSLLHIGFDDVRLEEWAPSYAGSSKRMDILVKKPKIVVEVKKTRKGLKDKEIGEELTIDKAHYKNHPDCKILYCFVYDPEGRISNPTGLENDLKENSSGFRVVVKIIQG